MTRALVLKGVTKGLNVEPKKTKQKVHHEPSCGERFAFEEVTLCKIVMCVWWSSALSKYTDRVARTELLHSCNACHANY